MPGQSPITHLLDSVRIRSHISRHRACANYYAWHHELPYCQVEYSYLPREPVFWQPTWNKDGTIRHDITIHDRYRAIRSSIKAKYRTFRDPIRTKYRTLNWFIRTKYRDLKAARVYPQHQSPLFRLPAELREYIYFYLVESKAVFHIYLDLFRIISRRCPSPLDWCQCQLRTSRLSESEYLGIIGLLMSCRRLYNETVNLVYSQIIFAFSDLKHFRPFTRAIASCFFDSIRFVSFRLTAETTEYWEWRQVWREVADLPALEELYVRLEKPPIVAMRDMTVRGEVEALRPLRNVTKPKVFEVELMWPEPRRSFLDVAFSKHDLDDVPFRVKRLDHRGELVPYVYPIS